MDFKLGNRLGNVINEKKTTVKWKSELQKFVLNVSQNLDLRRSNKYVALQNLSIYKTIHMSIYKATVQKQFTQNNIFNVEWWSWFVRWFYLESDFQDYIYSIKKISASKKEK